MRENSIPPTSDVPVMIVGAGPVGLTLAVGLAKQGIRSVVLEKKPELDEHSRALAVQATTLELLNSYGMADEFMQAGCFLPHINLHDVDRNKVVLRMSFDEISTETAYPGMLFLPQDRVERLLLHRALETGLCEVRFGQQFVSYTEASDHLVVSSADSSEGQTTMTASFLVGCDGAHSSIRRVWGEGLGGTTFPVRIRRLMGPIPVDESEEEALSNERVSNLVTRLIGPGSFEQNWVAAFSIHARIAPSFRKGRVLLAGDAAHISSPAGGLGMNSGMQDAQNLAWKLAFALKGGNIEPLLDSYDQERRPAIASFVLAGTTYLTRIILTASQRRLLPIALRAGGLALRNSRIRRAAGRPSTKSKKQYNMAMLINAAMLISVARI